MRKTVKKLMPCLPWYVGELESWFSDMAKEGLLLREFGSVFARFDKGEPSNMKYRIDVSQTVEKSQEQIKLYAENGWTFITNRSVDYVYASLAENNAPELHTDPAEQAFTLKKLLRSVSIFYLVWSLFLLIWIFYLLVKPAFVVDLVDNDYTGTGWFIAVLLFSFGDTKGLISMRRLKKTLSEGRPIDHSAPWQKKRRRRIASLYMGIIAMILPIVLTFAFLAGIKAETLPEVYSSLPIIRLADIDKNPDLVRTPPDMKFGYDQSNHYTYMYSFLAPSQYEVRETGIIKTEENETEGNAENDEQTASLYTDMCRLRFGWMNQWFLTGYLHKYSDWIMPLTEISNQRYDKIMVDKGDKTKRIIAIKGEYFIDLFYTGDVDMDTVLEAVADRLDQLSD